MGGSFSSGYKTEWQRPSHQGNNNIVIDIFSYEYFKFLRE